MTFRVLFYADQAFLSMVKNTIKRLEDYDGKSMNPYEPEETATCIIICQAALESFLNVFSKEIDLEDIDYFEKLSVTEKINYLYDKAGVKADWSRSPLQVIDKLRKSRNWLVHYKDSNVGLINSQGKWVKDGFNKEPKIDDSKELKVERIKIYYDCIRMVLSGIVKLYDRSDTYRYLETEDYDCYLVG